MRWKSTDIASTAIPSSIQPTPDVAATVVSTPSPEPAVEAASLSIDALAESLAPVIGPIPPFEAGDMVANGLAHFTPAGLIQYSVELVYLATGLPWFWTLVLTTLLWRLFIFPFSVIGARHTARMRPLQPRITELTQQSIAARQVGDTLGISRAGMEIAKLRKESNVSHIALMAPLIQLPISISMFFGIRNMCNLPLIHFTQSGLEWLPDLTQPGPYYILPIILAASGNALLLVCYLRTCIFHALLTMFNSSVHATWTHLWCGPDI